MRDKGASIAFSCAWLSGPIGWAEEIDQRPRTTAKSVSSGFCDPPIFFADALQAVARLAAAFFLLKPDFRSEQTPTIDTLN